MKKKIHTLFIVAGIISLLWLSSCSHCSLSGPEKNSLKKERGTVVASVFESGTTSKFKARIETGKGYYSGILVVKSTEVGFRTVLLNELGIKIFDFEFSGPQQDTFTVHYCISFLQRKIILNALHNNLRLLLFRQLDYSKKGSTGNGKELFLARGNDAKVIIVKSSDAVTGVHQKSWIRCNTEAEIKYSDQTPSEIHLKNARFSLHLNSI